VKGSLAQVDANCVNPHVGDPRVRAAITIRPYPGKDQAADHLISRLFVHVDWGPVDIASGNFNRARAHREPDSRSRNGRPPVAEAIS
jgi:hypothetical protein